MLKDICKDLTNFINKHNLTEQAFKDFKFAFENWKTNSPEHYEKVFGKKAIENMDVFVEEVSIRCTEWPECERQHIIITISIYDENSYVGDYNWLYPISKKATEDDVLYIL